ncbi:MAG TPA: tetratricopeptide repeat protein [Burkholderiales bacterium]|jgi:tetratricopeptide (TPR) repeat protein|nr:tetratricopeptide repeat protein [Burkholderiales bacterium]
MNDARGLTVSGASAKSLGVYERALRALNIYRGDPLAIIDEALAAQPDFAMGHVLRAQAQVTMWERSVLPGIRESVARLEALQGAMNDRERRHAGALKAWAAGDWQRHRDELGNLLAEYPRDLLALQVAHIADFFFADRESLRDRVARAMPGWSRDDDSYGLLLGMHAFGLEENGAYPKAEETGHTALHYDAEDCWAQHAVAHVLEMQSRQSEGIQFMELRTKNWAQADNGFAFHNWWHTALYHLDQGRPQRALEIYDAGIRPQPSELRVTMLDAAALLWRMRLRRLDVGKRWEELAASYGMGNENGFYAFNDMHAMMAFVATGRSQEAASLLKAVAASARESNTNGRMAREAGLAIVRAIEAFGREDYAEVVSLLAPVRDTARVIGGSNAQRDVLARTLLEAALRGGDKALARTLAEERVAQKPRCPFSQELRSRALQ